VNVLADRYRFAEAVEQVAVLTILNENIDVLVDLPLNEVACGVDCLNQNTPWIEIRGVNDGPKVRVWMTLNNIDLLKKLIQCAEALQASAQGPTDVPPYRNGVAKKDV
jgi:hypothetical protein